jgi:uncharacterized membrane protein
VSSARLKRRRLLGGPVAIVVGWSASSVIVGVQVRIALGIEGDLPTLVVPGLLAGTAFATVTSMLRMSLSGFDDLSLLGAMRWGAVGGLPLGMLAVVTAGGAVPLWPWAPLILGGAMLGSAITAAGSLALRRQGNPPPGRA